jgi:hypothetical protein
LEIDAAVAALVALRRSLIFGVRLADLLLRPAACETTAAAAAAPSESAVLVSTTRREMRRQSFMIDSHQA